jgi:hypothetical protein
MYILAGTMGMMEITIILKYVTYYFLSIHMIKLSHTRVYERRPEYFVKNYTPTQPHPAWLKTT